MITVTKLGAIVENSVAVYLFLETGGQLLPFMALADDNGGVTRRLTAWFDGEVGRETVYTFPAGTAIGTR